MLITTSFTSSTFCKVCFTVLSLTLLAGEKINVGGLEPKTLKKLNGLKFTSPFKLIVLANAIGLGATAVSKILCNSFVEIELGSMEVTCFIIFILQVKFEL